jgi:2-aminoadipate transaminase
MRSSTLSELARRTPEPPISWLMKLTLDRPRLISLAAGFTDNESLPVDEAAELLRDVLKPGKRGQTALQYGSTAGDSRLRDRTLRRIEKLDGIRTGYAADNPVITHGSQQLLYMLTEALCNPGDIVLVEDPTYFVYLGILQSHGIHARAVRLTPAGLEIDHLERVLEQLKRSGQLPRLKMLYQVTYFQNPTGWTSPLERKAAALALLRKYEKWAGHPIYLLEDAAYRELRFAGDDEPSALATRKYRDRVLYAGTYSKPFATGVRVGFGILPEPVRTAVLRIKGNHDFGTSNLLQQLLLRALETCKYESHLEEVHRRYRRKAQLMTNAIQSHFPANVAWTEPRGGLYVWATLPSGKTSGVKSRLFRSALDRDVLYVPGELCYAVDPARPKPNRDMRISFGGAADGDIPLGIARLGSILREIGRR